MKFKPGTFAQVPNIPQLMGLRAQTQVVYLWMNYHADRNGYCFPSASLLARETKLGRNSIFRALEELEKIGLLSREKRSTARGQSSNGYQIILIDQDNIDAGMVSLGKYTPSLPKYSQSLPEDTQASLPRDTMASLPEYTNNIHSIYNHTMEPTLAPAPDEVVELPKQRNLGNGYKRITKYEELLTLEHPQLLWLVEKSGVDIPNIIEQAQLAVEWAAVNPRGKKKAPDCMLFLKNWLVRQRQWKKIPFFVDSTGRWFEPGEWNRGDGTVTIISGEGRNREEITILESEYERRIHARYATDAKNFVPEEDETTL